MTLSVQPQSIVCWVKINPNTPEKFTNTFLSSDKMPNKRRNISFSVMFHHGWTQMQLSGQTTDTYYYGRTDLLECVLAYW
jgi:hypothetical protein